MGSLFSWVHISDLHFDTGDAERWSHELVRECLLEDVAALRAAEGPLDAILMTGGVVGAAKTEAHRNPSSGPRSYELAKLWLGELARAAGVGADRIFVIPGQHDVKTPASHRRRRSIDRLIERLRAGAERLDDAIADEDDRELLMSRLAHYLDFAGSLAPACFEPGDARRRLAWSHKLPGRRGLAVRLVGLTTTLLCDAYEGRDDDRGKLQLGTGQLGETLSTAKGGELLVVLSHHPFQDGWLADQSAARGWIESRAHVHLTGHASEADSVTAQRGGSRGIVRVAAGAANDRIAQGHRYNVAAIMPGGGGSLELFVWHRRWSNARKSFVPDVDLVPPGQWYATHSLDAKLAIRPETNPGAGLLEDFRSRSELLSRRIQGALSATAPEAAREATALLERELHRYVASVDEDLKRARGSLDPGASEALAELRGEAKELRQRAQRTLSRAKLRLMLVEGPPSESDVFSCSGALVALGTEEDIKLLTEASTRWGFDFLPMHLRALEERLVSAGAPETRRA